VLVIFADSVLDVVPVLVGVGGGVTVILLLELPDTVLLAVGLFVTDSVGDVDVDLLSLTVSLIVCELL